jgi:hypothetical protein
MTITPTRAETTRTLLSRVTPLRTRAFPPIEKVRRAVEGILTRWPDAVRTPEDRDRERLALEMLQRTSEWNWKKVTTQRVISAAIAVFDKERCARSDLAPVRDFYLAEIATREPGAFLDGMVGVYVDTFSEGAAHTHALGRALVRRCDDLGSRHRKLYQALPGLFQPDDAADHLAQQMVDADDAYVEMKRIGLSRPHTSGLALAAQQIFIRSLAPDLADPGARQKLFKWLTPENGPVLQSGAGPAVEALLAIWRDRTPPDALRNELCEVIIAAWNDPRLHSGGIWSGFDAELKGVLLRWLTHQDMKFFCNMVTATQNSHMWAPRRDFWLKLYDDKMIDEAWVAFGSEARRYAQQHLVRSGKTDMNRRFGRQLDRGGSTSLLIMRIGNKIVVDGCHNYRTHIFRLDDKKAPKLYARDYYCDNIMRGSRNAKSHSSIPSWSQWVLQHV